MVTVFEEDIMVTVETASLAANANMSAQETVLAHFSSTAFFMSLMTSKPAKVKLGIASFSAVLLLVELNKTEPSQPRNVHICNLCYTHCHVEMLLVILHTQIFIK